MKLAFLYAGQGSQTPGMGRDLYEDCPSIRPIFDLSADKVGFDLKELCFESTPEQLAQTRYTQPCMVAFATAVTQLFSEAGVRPDYAAGLSLGEYSALSCAGVFTPEQAVEIAAYRGRAMEEAAAGHQSKMVAILGTTQEKAEDACRIARKETGLIAEVANLNCAGQVVIGGDAEAVDRACELAKAGGAKRCVPLNVSAAFHTSLMAPAGKALADLFPTVQFHQMELPVVMNVDAKPHTEEGDLPDVLVRQVQSTTRFEDTIHYLIDQGVDTVVEIGPGKVLSGFVKKSGPLPQNFRLIQVENRESLAEAIEMLKGA